MLSVPSLTLTTLFTTLRNRLLILYDKTDSCLFSLRNILHYLFLNLLKWPAAVNKNCLWEQTEKNRMEHTESF